MKENCLYYRAKIERNKVVIFTAILRSIEDNLAFDRIENKTTEIFEFFVPFGMNNRFNEIMKMFILNDIISNYYKENIEKSSIYCYLD